MAIGCETCLIWRTADGIGGSNPVEPIEKANILCYGVDRCVKIMNQSQKEGKERFRSKVTIARPTKKGGFDV